VSVIFSVRPSSFRPGQTLAVCADKTCRSIRISDGIVIRLEMFMSEDNPRPEVKMPHLLI
jgi:hypothetical protein